MRRLAFLAIVSICAIPALSAKPVKERPSPPSEWSVLAFGAQRPDVFNENLEGTRVVAQFRLPNRFIVGIDRDHTGVKFTDDKGNDLHARPFINGLSDLDEKLASDFRSGVIVFTAASMPAKGSSTVLVKGSVAVHVASNEKTIELHGAKLVDGKVDLGFGRVGPVKSVTARPFRGTDHSRLSYGGRRPIKSMLILTDQGKEVVYKRETSVLAIVGTERFSSIFSRSASKGFKGAKVNDLTKCTIRVTYFDTVETLIIPVDLNVRLGF